MALVYNYRSRGDFSENIEKAVACYEAALTVWTFEAHPFNWAATANNLAAVYIRRVRGDRSKNIETAIKLYGDSLKIRTKEKFPKFWADTKSNLALCYRKRLLGDAADNLEKAIELLNETLDVRSEKNLRNDFTGTLFNLGYAYFYRVRGERRENLEKAARYYERYLQIINRDAYPRYYILALNYRAEVLAELAAFRSRADSDKAVDLLNEALGAAGVNSLPRECRGTAINLTGVLIGQGRWGEALEVADTGRTADRYLQKQATSITGRTREAEEGAVLYYLASLAAARLGDMPGALDWLEQGRTRELGESLERDRMLLDRKIREDDRKRYLEMVEHLRDLEAEQRGAAPGQRSFLEVAGDVERRRVEFEKLIAKIQSYEPEFFKTERFSESRIASLLTDEKTCLLACNVTSRGSAVYLLAVSEGLLVSEASFSEKFTTARLTEIAEAWTSGMKKNGNNDPGDLIETTTRPLYDELFAGAFDLLQRRFEGVERLVLVPHLLLHILPIHLIRLPSVERSKYLVEEYDTSFAPGVNVLLAQKDRAPGSLNNLLIVNDPTENLDWSAMEVESVEKFFPGSVRRLAGAGATRATFIDGAKEADVLHIACHGFFNPSDPWSSGIILAGEPDTDRERAPLEEPGAATRDDLEQTPLEESGAATRDDLDQAPFEEPGAVSRDDLDQAPFEEPGAVSRDDRGLLTLKEITYGIDLSGAELVVLSACETGLVSPGDGSDEFIGLPGGFLRAGARYIVASLWAVDDLSTSLLMSEFYRLMLVERLTPARALREAQTAFINHRSWNDPYYWGAFRIFGA